MNVKGSSNHFLGMLGGFIKIPFVNSGHIVVTK